MNLKEKVKEAFEEALDEGTSEGAKKGWETRRRHRNVDRMNGEEIKAPYRRGPKMVSDRLAKGKTKREKLKGLASREQYATSFRGKWKKG